jgi:hypothetical protein
MPAAAVTVWCMPARLDPFDPARLRPLAGTADRTNPAGMESRP